MPDKMIAAIPVIVAILIVVVVAEILSRRAKDIEGFYVMHRGANLFLLTGGYAAAWASITGMLGTAGLGYRMGIGHAMLVWGFWGPILFGFAIGIPLTRLNRNMDKFRDVLGTDAVLYTPTDFFTLRFPSEVIRIASALLLIIGMTAYALGQVLGLAICLGMVGVKWELGILITVLLIVYSCWRAGSPGVIVNDTINMLTFVVAALILAPIAIKSVGGMHNMVSLAEQTRPGIWAGLGIGATFAQVLSLNLVWNSMTTGSPHLAQRAFMAKDERTFIKATVLSITIVIFWVWLVYLSCVGTGISSFPGLKGTASDSIVPMVAEKVLSPFWAGLVYASIFAVGYSTVSAQVNITAFSLAHDLYQRITRRPVREHTLMLATRLAILLVCVALFILAYSRPGFIFEITAWGVAFYGAAFVPMFIFGLWCKRINTQGVIAGSVISVLLYIILSLMKYIVPGFTLPYKIHPFLVSLITSIVLMVGVSYVTKQSEKEERIAENLKEFFKPIDTRAASMGDYMIFVLIILASLGVGLWLTIGMA